MRISEIRNSVLFQFIRQQALLCALVLTGISNYNFALCQDKAVKQERSRMSLSAIQEDSGQITLQALVRARINSRYVGLPALEVIFKARQVERDVEVGKAVSNEDGMAIIHVSAATLPFDSAGIVELLAEFGGNPEFISSDDDISLTAARLRLEPEQDDSLKIMNMILESQGQPVGDENVSLFVKGLFFPLKIGEGTTNSDGIAKIDFPSDLPGDKDGNLTIIGQLEDHDDYGTVSTIAVESWGIPVAESSSGRVRALWSPFPPLWLLITFLAILFGIWLHYFIIIYRLYGIKKLEDE